MKVKSLNFKNFIISEAKSIAKDNNFNIELKENLNVQKTNETTLDLKDDFEDVNVEDMLEDSKKAKNLSEEVSRMKDLLSFNNPLLKK